MNGNEPKTAGGIFLPKTALPKMEAKTQLKADKDKVEKSKSQFFWAVWAFLSATTAVFGFQHLADLFLPMLGFVPLSAEGVFRTAQWLGAIMALLFLDVGYMRWGYLRLHATKTIEQVNIATIAEWFAFGGSVYFTAAVIASVFVDLLPPVFINGLQVFGAVIFIASAITTMVCRFLFDRFSPESMAQANHAKSRGRETTEILELYRQAKEDSLANAKTEMEKLLPEISADMANELANQIKAEMTGQLRAPTPSKTGTPSRNGARPKATRSH